MSAVGLGLHLAIRQLTMNIETLTTNVNCMNVKAMIISNSCHSD